MAKVWIGIDPGIDGAIAFLGLPQPVVSVLPVVGAARGRELDATALRQIIRVNAGPDAIAYVEKVGSMPQQGIASAFKFGDTYGGIKAVVRTCRIPLLFVTPTAWKKKVLAGLNWKGNKKMAEVFCRDRWPGADLKRTPRCKGPHDGICDALCIAEFGRLTHEEN